MSAIDPLTKEHGRSRTQSFPTLLPRMREIRIVGAICSVERNFCCIGFKHCDHLVDIYGVTSLENDGFMFLSEHFLVIIRQRAEHRPIRHVMAENYQIAALRLTVCLKEQTARHSPFPVDVAAEIVFRLCGPALQNRLAPTGARNRGPGANIRVCLLQGFQFQRRF